MELANFFQLIDKQIKSNELKNLFHEKPGLFRFIKETVSFLDMAKELPENSRAEMVKYASDKTLEAFCRVNQYFSFNDTAKEELKNLYHKLITEILEENYPYEILSDNHYDRLRYWLLSSNPFASRLYTDKAPVIEPVVCAEYSPDTQIAVLGIDIYDIMQPVLDIGCGTEGLLIQHLRMNGIEAFGIDRFNTMSAQITQADWLDFRYGDQQWGTIVSHLGFSNHFIHHHLREDGAYLKYGKTYARIISSLKRGGAFYYAPSLPFIEPYLDPENYRVEKKSIPGNESMSTKIIRL